jgi:hypothetical protein
LAQANLSVARPAPAGAGIGYASVGVPLPLFFLRRSPDGAERNPGSALFHNSGAQTRRENANLCRRDGIKKMSSDRAKLSANPKQASVPHSRRGHNWHSLGPHLKHSLRDADIFRPTREFNMKDAHNKAAEQHETAAKSHRAAADAHDKNDHVKGKEHSSQAQQHAQNASDQSKAAHAKSNQQK